MCSEFPQLARHLQFRSLQMNIRTMTADDIAAGVRLKEIAGWNQTEADWQRFLEASPQGCFVAEVNDKVRGTVTTIVFENRFAWVGMVLIDPEFRSRGLGTALLERAIQYLDDLKIATIKLDATPQGKPLYEKLGFLSEYEIERWTLQRASPGDTRIPSRWVSASAELSLEILEIDREVFGADRSALLRSLHREAPEFTILAWAEGFIQGYALGRRGAFADHLGPWMARSSGAGQQLLETFLSSSSRQTLIVDYIKANQVAAELLERFGFSYARTLTRMYRGANRFPGQPDMLWAILGPEFG
jgi:GNAT superfamily N-acetyltransferase